MRTTALRATDLRPKAPHGTATAPFVSGRIASRVLALALTALAPVVAAAPARAQPEARDPAADDERDARCRRVRAAAESSAFLLFSPTIWAEGVHVPVLGDESGAGYVQGGEWQIRAALSMSAIDVVRGAMVLDAAGAECRQLQALARARRTLEIGESAGELEARRAERDALSAELDRARRIVGRAETRVREGLATETQLAQLRAEADRLARRADQLDAEIARLAEAGRGADPARLRADLDEYERATMTLERQRSSLRRLSPWTVHVRAGIVPVDQVDWFGQVQLGFNLGGLAQQIAEDHLLDARSDELAESDAELRAHVERFERRMRESARSLRVELAHAERQLELVTRQRELLGQLETSDVDHLRSMLELSAIGLEAERAHLAALIAARERVAGDPVRDGDEDGHRAGETESDHVEP